jgi:hypothetical protein
VVRKKRQPPAKIRYDRTHPIVSIRVDQKLKQQLEKLKAISGKSVGDVLRVAMKTQRASCERAYRMGEEAGKRLYGVQYKCSVCGGTMWINTPDEKKAAAEYMRDEGWGHGGCID